MIFHVSYEFSPESRNVTQERFKATGAPPPEGVKMLGRWHLASGHGGFLLAEADSAVAIATWFQEWTDLIVFDIEPVLNDEEIAGVIG